MNNIFTMMDLFSQPLGLKVTYIHFFFLIIFNFLKSSLDRKMYYCLLVRKIHIFIYLFLSKSYGIPMCTYAVTVFFSLHNFV